MNDSDYHLHVIAFDVPYPANYGGVIDVFYRVKALSEAGVKVHLHCFEYGRGEQEILKRCYEVKYYKRLCETFGTYALYRQFAAVGGFGARPAERRLSHPL